ncbi:MAG: PAS domain S-box protein [Candidatus Cyclobacteriaceae bacterium M3_2C_046]
MQPCDLISAIDDPVLIIDKDHTIQDVNQEALDLFGKDRSAVVGEKCFRILHHDSSNDLPDCPVCQSISQAIDQQVSFDQTLFSKDYSVKLYPVHNDNGEVVQYLCKWKEVKILKDKEKLQEALLFNQQIINSASEGILVYDRDFNVLIWNAILEDISGIPSEDAVGRNIHQLFPQFDHSQHRLDLTRALQGEVVEVPASLISLPDIDKELWVKSLISPNYNIHGDIIGLVEIVSDVTSYKIVEMDLLQKNSEIASQHEEIAAQNEEFQALNEEIEEQYKIINDKEKQFRSVFENSATGIIIFDSEGIVEEANHEVAQLLGYDIDEMRGKTYQRFLHADDFNTLIALFAKLEKGEIPFVKSDKRFRDKHNSLIWVNLNMSRIELDGAFFYVAHLVDINQRKEIEYQLSNSEQRYRALYDHAPLSYQSLDQQGLILDVNKTWLKTLGYEKNEVVGKSFENYLHPEYKSFFEQRFPLFLKEGSIHDVQFKLRHKEGHFLHVSYEGCVGYASSGNVDQTYCVFKDITQEKELVDKLKLKEEQYDRTSFYLKEKEKLVTSIYRTLPIGIGIITNRIFNLVNDQFCRMTGYHHDQIVGKSSELLYLSRQDYEKVGDEIYREVLDHGIGRIESSWKNNDGKVINVLIQVSFLNQEDNSFIFSVLDITERKQYERHLLESENRYKSIFEDSASYMLIVDPEKGKIIDVNRSALAFYGYTKQEMLGLNVSDINISSNPEEVNEKMGRASRAPSRFQFVHKLADGQKKHVEVHSGPVIFSGKLYLFSIIHDKSIEKAQEQSLLEITDNLVKAQKIAKLGSWEMDVRTQQLKWSDQLYKLYGYEEQSFEPTMEHMIQAIHPDEREQVMEKIMDSIHNSKDYHTEKRVIHPDGTMLYVQSRGEVVENNGTFKVTGTVLDITERKKAELALESNSFFINSVINNLQEGVLVMDLELRYILWNKKMEIMTGKKAEEVLGQKAMDIFPHLKQLGFDQYLQKALEGHIVSTHDVTFVQTDGQTIWYYSTYSPNLSIDGKIIGVIAVLTEITDRKKAESNLKEKNEELIKANQELDNFVYRVSHDLRAPITSSLGLSRLSQLEPSSEKLHQYAQLQEQSLVKLDKFIRDILDYSRNTRMEIVPEKIDFQQIIQDLLENLNKLPENKRVKLDLKLNQDCDFYSDKLRMGIIINNIVSNAYKFQNQYQENPYIEIAVEINCEKSIMVIKDNGIGIAKEHQEKIFNMFYRATDKKPGSGIGLYIVQDCLKKLNGSIQLQSALDQGSCFTIALPNMLHKI